MSELEKQQRDQYQLKRDKAILFQRVILVILTLALLASFIAYIKMDKDTYVYYTEEGNAIHRAYLIENDFYEETYLNGSHAYVTSLVEKMTGDFSYHLAFDTDRVEFKYNYRIDAQLEILDKNSTAPLYNPTFEILPLTTESSVGNQLSINKLVDIDFQKYNDIAKAYLLEYDLKDTSSTLVVRMHVNVVGASEAFANDRSGEYVTELRIPLVKAAFKPEVTSTVPAGEQKIVAIDGTIKNMLGIVSILLGAADVLALVILLIYAAVTKNKYVDYRRQVDRILKNYRSYIQQTTNAFDMSGYQVLHLKHINELLDIHDTVQKPIICYENSDRTHAQFFITADGKLIYLYEIFLEGIRRMPAPAQSAPASAGTRAATRSPEPTSRTPGTASGTGAGSTAAERERKGTRKIIVTLPKKTAVADTVQKNSSAIGAVIATVGAVIVFGKLLGGNKSVTVHKHYF